MTFVAEIIDNGSSTQPPFDGALPHDQPTEIRTERLLLRPFRSSDVDDALEYRDDAEFCRYLPHIPQPFTRPDAEAFVALNTAEPWDRSPTFAIVLDDKVIGTVNFEVDAPRGIAMLGFAIGCRYWGRGLGTEAARVAVAWAFEEFDLAKLWATTDVRNTRSRRLLEKLGMKCEGVLRGEELARDGRTDKAYYGLLREGWDRGKVTR